MFLQTKIGTENAKKVHSCLDRFRTELGVDYFDSVLIDCVDAFVGFSRPQEIDEAIRWMNVALDADGGMTDNSSTSVRPSRSRAAMGS